MYKITLFRDVCKPSDMIEKEYSFETIYKFLIKERAATTKKKQVAWCPATFQKGSKRSNHNCLEVSLMVIDIDGLWPYVYCKRTFDKMRLQYCMHTSFSHKSGKDKYRVIFPLKSPVPAAEWQYYHKGMCNWWDETIHYPNNVYYHNKLRDSRTDLRTQQEELDRGAHDPCRAYFAGGYPNPYKCHDIRMDGTWVDWDSWAEKAKIQEEAKRDKKRIEAEEAKKRMQAHLKHLEGKRVSSSDKRRYYYEMLKTQRSWRQTLAQKMGAAIVPSPHGDRAEKWICPQCQRDDATYFYIDPIQNISSARCGHMNSCGWSNSVGYLAEITGNLRDFGG